ncbi:LAMI_0F03928g1_1 [Lachancea mirantina]|uniref:DNA polymerase n=1 Tax=Lachancea mirantina TaxID=1230905 RepID=A0A1G4JXP6_9SACH|nr:LAMI_0F03928g1_1 [Lachancea mirantina]
MSSDGSFNATSLSLSENHVHIQMNAHDFYLTSPSSLDRSFGNSLPNLKFGNVPVIRVYGALPTGHRILCHIHGVLPYIIIDYDGDDEDSIETIKTRCSQLHQYVETRLAEATVNKKTKKRKTDRNSGDSGDVAKDENPDKSGIDFLRFIADVCVVKGVPFYGYHCGWRAFYKITMLNPAYTTKLSDLLRQGKFDGLKRKTYESHLPFLLQFSTDYNLYGCSWLKATNCYFRTPVLNEENSVNVLYETEDLTRFLNRFNKGGENCLDRSFKRMGHSLLEIDILAQHIDNRRSLEYRDLHNTLFEGSLTDNGKTLFISSTKELWNQIEALRQQFGLDPWSEPQELKRTIDEHIWQNDRELQQFLKKAEKRTATKSPGIANPDKTALPLFNFATTPSDALLNLQPEPLTFLEKADFGAGTTIFPRQTTALKEMSVEPENSEGSDEGESEVGEADEAGVKEIVTSSPSESEQPLKLIDDETLTQNLLKRKSQALNANEIANHGPSKRSKIILSSSESIPQPPNSWKYYPCSVMFDTILNDLESCGLPKIRYQGPFFSNPLDLKRKEYVYSGRHFSLTSPHLSCRKALSLEDPYERNERQGLSTFWRYLPPPPTFNFISQAEKVSEGKGYNHRSQIDYKNSSNEFGYKYKSNDSLKKLSHGDHEPLSHLCAEVHVNTRGPLIPDPKYDAIQMIFWRVEEGSFTIDIGLAEEGVFVLCPDDGNTLLMTRIEQAAGKVPVAFYNSEYDLLDAFANLVLLLDPDILSGYEVNSGSWGYIIERFECAFGLDFTEEISRLKMSDTKRRTDRYGRTHTSGVTVPGRHILNIWRMMRSSVNVLKYTLENLAFHVLHERLPHFSFKDLSALWKSADDITSLVTVISYWRKRVEVDLRLLQNQQTIPQTVEQARLLGIDFYSVFYRGSQFKVESVLARLCKSEHFLLSSPSKWDVRNQKALECIPMVMEPESAFYKSPLVVLDFQSLYPSIMIAYNYCYSTILGRVHDLRLHRNEVGTVKLDCPPNFLSKMEKSIRVSPNGSIFVKSDVRRSMLSKMLNDILDTRFLVKSTMSDLKGKNDTISKLLNNKQVALKLLANVTYGYTSASFSGRMPCSDIADSIVQTGRETLDKAISLIEKNVKWGAKVVYGDTDSLFVYFPGKSRDEAFEFGREMAAAVTSANPQPIKLQFEKVYHPCVLVSKKRYVGYSYEKEAQKVPFFDAKGIETVRRDGHPAQQKIVEKCLRILFDTKDLSLVKAYLQEQFTKIMKGEVSVQDFCFAKEVKLGSYKSEKTQPAGALVATKKMKDDRRAEPQYKERVSYVVIKGRSGQILRERCIPPDKYLANEDLELDSTYYITKTLIPPLQRFFNLMGVDIQEWYNELSRVQGFIQNKSKENQLPKFMKLTSCVNCRQRLQENRSPLLCDDCLANKREAISMLLHTKFSNQTKLKDILTVCRSCCEPLTKNVVDNMEKVVLKCDSQDCPVYYSKIKYENSNSNFKTQQINDILELTDEW